MAAARATAVGPARRRKNGFPATCDGTSGGDGLGSQGMASAAGDEGQRGGDLLHGEAVVRESCAGREAKGEEVSRKLDAAERRLAARWARTADRARGVERQRRTAQWNGGSTF
ncbi:hypothetical protein PR202_ga31215 [Eleusine coracana subsp. coracana]|uniref:Uncharacterized protein n=1 Tax=Eleusine coracana subsp. coracana TaxID=191504 RepID=A0AAV5DRC1_ELECO|nr:hypothetical protein PR202_ga31215 [Eleusine coracana subsp. coracana]